jgi:hypothetical protein
MSERVPKHPAYLMHALHTGVPHINIHKCNLKKIIRLVAFSLACLHKINNSFYNLSERNNLFNNTP